jgi:hypothetical protein
MKSICFVFFVTTFLHTTSGHAQDLVMQSGNKTKTIRANTFVRLSLLVTDETPCVKCAAKRVTGLLVASKDDHIEILAREINDPMMSGDTVLGQNIKYYRKRTLSPTLIIPKSDVLSVLKRGNKKFSNNNIAEGLGLTLAIFGAGTLSAAPLVSDADTANELIRVGLAEMVTGIAIAKVFENRVHYTNTNCPGRDVKDRVWEIR